MKLPSIGANYLLPVNILNRPFRYTIPSSIMPTPPLMGKTLGWLPFPMGRGYIDIWVSDQALKMAQKAVALGQDVSHPFSLGFSLCYGAVAHQFCQDLQRVDELVETAITLSTEQGFVLWLALATVLRGWVLAKQGKAEEGIVQMRQGLADYKAISVYLSRPYLLAL
jgi:hypothetical protein